MRGASPPRLSLVVAVYNDARALGLVLDALGRQTFRDFELVIADDGSGPEIAALAEARAGEAGFRVSRVWHPDRGFRKNAILNRAVAAAEAPWLVFIDGDCIPHERFLEDHARHARPGAVLCGRRVNLGPGHSARATPEAVRSGRFARLTPALVADGLLGRSAWVEEGFRTENGFLRRLLHRGAPSILGCNFSVHREWLERINGFNEEYEGPGQGEDSDVGFRLTLAGAELVSLRNLAILFHLHHPATAVAAANRRIYERVVATREMVCRVGLSTRAEAVHAE